jgi:hypothetical protein
MMQCVILWIPMLNPSTRLFSSARFFAFQVPDSIPCTISISLGRKRVVKVSFFQNRRSFYLPFHDFSLFRLKESHPFFITDLCCWQFIPENLFVIRLKGDLVVATSQSQVTLNMVLPIDFIHNLPSFLIIDRFPDRTKFAVPANEILIPPDLHAIYCVVVTLHWLYRQLYSNHRRYVFALWLQCAIQYPQRSTFSFRLTNKAWASTSTPMILRLFTKGN